MGALVGIGECMVELWADQPLAEARTFQRSYGGDVLNSLVAAARLGATARFITRVGNDAWTPALMSAWQSEGVEVQATQADTSNGLYFISLLPGGEREFAYYRRGSAASTIEPSDLAPTWHDGASMLLVSGITQAISATVRATTLAAAQQAREHGLGVAFDPNFRPRLWSVSDAQAALHEILPHITILLPSLGDETEALWETSDPHALIETAWEHGVAFVAAKAGPNGVWLGERGSGEIVQIPALQNLPAVDTTAAGDAFNGGFLARLLAGDELRHAARDGVIMAGLTITRRGAVAALPNAAEVAQFRAQIAL